MHYEFNLVSRLAPPLTPASHGSKMLCIIVSSPEVPGQDATAIMAAGTILPGV
jgi:hypothetical protein